MSDTAIAEPFSIVEMDVDMDATRACQTIHAQCPLEADWMYRCLNCNRLYGLCQAHHDRAQQREMSPDWVLWNCKKCGSVSDTLSTVYTWWRV